MTTKLIIDLRPKAAWCQLPWRTPLLKQGVCYGQTVTSLELKKQKTTHIQIREAVPSYHTPPVVTVVDHMGAEIHQQN